jgi:multidrug efflux pump subunit AcrA (membrane-fusion protein)
VPKLKAGAPARVIGPEAYAPEEARLRDVPGSVDPVTATAPIRLELASVSKLPAGAPVRVEITAAERADALVVPTAACVREADETFVYTVGGDGKARRTRVTTGLATEAETEILSGLKEADAVVVAGQTALPDGATVTVRK